MSGKELVIKKETKEFLDKVLEKHEFNSAKMITILQNVQHEYKYLPEETLDYIAYALKVSPAKIYGVATFYSHFSITPKGKYIVKICDGTACHVKKSEKMLHKIYSVLDLKDGKNTTDDLLFTVETVSCLGACGLAPVMTINDEVYGQVTEKKIEDILNKILKEETENENK